MKFSLKLAAIIAAATIGEGVFALPYAFREAGWLTCLVYFLVFGAVVTTAHVVYFKTLAHEGEKKRLLGLARTYFGTAGFGIGIFAIVIGLLLALVAYLILGSRFLTLAVPGLNPSIALAIFWLCVTLPLFASDGKVAGLEIAGVTLTTAIVLFVFGNALPHPTLATGPIVNPQNLFLPFGVILLSLAGWTGIEPMYESWRGRLPRPKEKKPFVAIALGTAIAATLYLLFVAGISGSASHITADTVSGLGDWTAWKRYLVAGLGLVAIGTSYMPISREIKNSLQHDMHWNGSVARFAIATLPVLVILAGFNNFFAVAGLVGGVFVSLEYLLIVAVGRRALAFSPVQKLGLDIVSLTFITAAVYQIVSFVSGLH